MKKFLAVLTACTTVFTSAFVCNKANAEMYDYENVSYGKAVFLGNCGVGQKKIIKRIYTDSLKSVFDYDSYPIGASFIPVYANINGLQYEVRLFDTEGQEQYRSIAAMILRGADVAIICCNYGDKSSFDSVEDWVNLARNQRDCKIILTASTTITNDDNCEEDLSPSDWNFSKDDLEKLGEQLGVDLIIGEISPYNGSNMNNLFNETANFCVENDRTRRAQYNQKPEDNTDNNRKKCLIC